MQQTKWFYNFLDEKFEASWNSEVWSFPSKGKMLLQAHLADHFAKHLVDLALHRAGKQVTDQTRPELLAKCLVADGTEYANEEKAEAEALNANAAASPEKKKAGRPKTVKAEPEADAAKEVFEGLES